MKFVTALSAAAATMAMAVASPADAALKVVNFTINGGDWLHINGVTGPYGLADQPTLSGSVTLDSTLTGASSFVGLQYVTGSRVWTLADIGPTSSSYFAGGAFVAFAMVFNVSGSVVGSNNTAVVAEGPNTIYCNGCVKIDSVRDPSSGPVGVPEPSAWALALMGFGAVGVAMRRRRGVVFG